MHELTTRRRVEFSDTDAGGVMHFSRYFIFMESAEDEFLRAVGASFTHPVEGGPGGWPKVAAACEYSGPARYGDVLEIHVVVARRTRSTITWRFTLSRDGVELARGRTTSVCCALGPDGRFRSSPIPAEIAERIQEAPEA
jgi:YbgC/YbaW family acyl-CoA thioester hydrolase